MKSISFLPSKIEIGLSLVYTRVSQNFSKLDLIGRGGGGVTFSLLEQHQFPYAFSMC